MYIKKQKCEPLRISWAKEKEICDESKGSLNKFLYHIFKMAIVLHFHLKLFKHTPTPQYTLL